MKEIKCPKCGTAIPLDAEDYAAILSQVRTEEFNSELGKQVESMRKNFDLEKEISEAKLSESFRKIISEKELELQKLQNERDLDKQQHEKECKMLQEEVERYKDFKAKLSTKMIGESLEQHCSNLFEQYLRPLLPNATFGKDNTVVDGTKGDFVFRDKVDGTEYISIMFEMKNEADGTEKKKKNVDFLEKLDEDRTKKGCEFAVLVSMLEPDSDLYNNGIVDKSYVYDKMYVIRPQFFVPFIQLLVQTSRKTLSLRKELERAKNMHMGFTDFESKLNECKSGILVSFEGASKNIDDAIKQIDNSINNLNKVKENLQKAQGKMSATVNKTGGLTVRKLTYGNSTVKEMIEQARQAQGDAEASTPASGTGAA